MLRGSGGSLRRRLTHDAAAPPLSARQQQILQAFVLVACSLSFIGLSFVILHYIWERVVRRCLSLCRLRVWWRRRHPHQQSHHQHPFAVATPQYRDPLASATGATPRDFNALLVFILSWIDLMSVLARMVGRTVLHEPTWCVVQASVIHASALASCLWTTCLSFNLYRWIVFGESDKKRRARLLPFLTFTFVPSALLVVYPLRAHKYGNATFYCWIMEPVLMFLHFYVFYVALAVLNVSLLLLIRMNLKQRVRWYDSDGTDATAAVIRGKALHYIVIFLIHRVPILVYRAFQIVGVQSFAVGVAVQFILNLDGFSNAVVYGGLFKKIPGVRFKHSPTLDSTPVRFSSESNYDFGSSSISIETDEYCASKMFKSNQKGLFAVEEEHCERMADTSVSSVSAPTASRDISSTNTGPSSSSCSEPATRTIDVQSCPLASPKQLPPAPGTGARASKTRRFAAGILDRASLERGSDRVAKQQPRERSQSFSIFVSTFNMGEQNIPERELVEWIPIGHEIYVIGVQECMNLGDLQTKILHHLVSTTKQKYIHFSREIGKRATALGYHGYIALTVFVLEEAILQGRFEMPHREAMSKQAQEVYRGKSLLLFGRASNKGAVGISFRYNNTSFAFVTCHLASDSAGSSKKLTFRSKQSAAESTSGSASVDGSTATSSFLDSSDGSQRGRHHHQGRPPPSKFERRNQDAMEILQQLHLDEEDYGFSFPHLHHHSFVLGDLNYRMTRQYALPNEMLDMLTQVGVAKTRATKARSLSGVSSRSPPPPVLSDTYEAVATPTTLRGDVPVAPVVLNALIRDHDELTMLRESSQLFHGFTEAPITFFPTFRRIRGERLDSFDTASFQRNYSLMASGGGLRVPSYTDRIMYASLPGRNQQVRCLYYDSCEAVTSSDHKPVCAVFRVGATAEDAVADVNAKSTPQRMMTMPRMPSLFGTPPPVLCRNDSCEKAACDVLLKVDFRSIRWMDAVDVGVGNLFSRLENIEVGFLFPLPCEDVLSQQRKLQQVAENLNWGESIDMAAPLPFSTSISGSPTATNAGASPNFHVAAWNTFVEQGLRCPTRVAPVGKKHVALAIRTRSRTVQRSVSGPRSRSRVGSTAGGATNTMGGGCGGTSVSGFTTAGGAIPSVGNSFTSSGSYELSLGHGAFCIEKVGKRQDTVVPLTMGGNLVGRLHLRVTLQVRPK